jgi:hypothetical protein
MRNNPFVQLAMIVSFAIVYPVIYLLGVFVNFLKHPSDRT